MSFTRASLQKCTASSVEWWLVRGMLPGKVSPWDRRWVILESNKHFFSSLAWATLALNQGLELGICSPVERFGPLQPLKGGSEDPGSLPTELLSIQGPLLLREGVGQLLAVFRALALKWCFVVVLQKWEKSYRGPFCLFPCPAGNMVHSDAAGSMIFHSCHISPGRPRERKGSSKECSGRPTWQLNRNFLHWSPNI